MKTQWVLGFSLILLSLLPFPSLAIMGEPVLFVKALKMSYVDAKTSIESPNVNDLSINRRMANGINLKCRLSRRSSGGPNIVMEVSCFLPLHIGNGLSGKYRIDLVKTAELNYKTNYRIMVTANGGRNLSGEIELFVLLHGKSAVSLKVIESTYSRHLIQTVKVFLEAAKLIEPRDFL